MIDSSKSISIFIFFFFFLMIRRPPRFTRETTLFPTRRSSDLRGHVEGSIAARLCQHRLYVERSEEHTSELQSQSHISYAVFCLKKKKKKIKKKQNKKNKKHKKKRKTYKPQ